MIGIRCQFLLGSYQASDPLVGFAEAEWPPHPARLHASLVASAWATGGGDAIDTPSLETLRLLEQAPPRIVIPEGVPTRTPATVFVWQNPAANKERKRGYREFPAAIPGDEPVWFCFGLDELPDRLPTLVEGIAYLGSSRSPVCCDVALDPDLPRGIELVPADRGERSLRVARPGFTDELVEDRFVYPPGAFGAVQSYARHIAEPAEETPSGPFDELLVARFADSFPLMLQHAPLVTVALRRAVLAQAGDSAPPVLHGHDCNPHTAFLALADTGHRHASGALKGVAVAIPSTATAAERDAITSALRSVERLTVDHRLSPVRLEAGGELRVLTPERWIGPSRVWRSVTPVVVDRHPKAASGGVEGALRLAVANALLPAPVRVGASTVPFTEGPPLAGAFRGEIPRGMRVHVELEFERPVRGPVLIGKGRYLGIGMFAPTERP